MASRKKRRAPKRRKPSKTRRKPKRKAPVKVKPKKRPKPPSPSLRELSRDWQQYFSELMASACAGLDELSCHYRTHINPDSSVHADMTIEGFGRGNARRVLLDIERAGDWARTGDAVWITIGINVEVLSRRGGEKVQSPPIDRGVYKRWTYPQRTANASENFVTARELVSNIESLEGANLRVRGIIIRLHWNPLDTQPTRPKTRIQHG